MKKILSIFLLICLLLSMVSCRSQLPSEVPPEETVENKKEDEITYPDSFAVGYSSVDISGSPGTHPISYYGGTALGVHDPLMLTCIALWDGEEIALVMTADLKKMFEELGKISLDLIEQEFGIPQSNIIISCTHTHGAPDAGSKGTGNVKWSYQYRRQLLVAVEEALRDLDPVEKVFTGKAEQPGIGFVRRYLLENGTWKMNPSRSMKPIKHESEADPEMRTVRFERENKKDVLLVNFQTHYYSAEKKYPNQFTADFVGPFRESAQKEFDCLFAYFSGASADINQIAMLPEDNKAEDPDEAFMDGLGNCISEEKEVPVGKIKIQHSDYTATCMVRTPERIAQADEITKLGTSTAEGKALMQKYGFVDANEVSFTLYYKNLEPTQEIPFTAIAFGDVAFVSASYEMFHENGSYVRENSPYETTFICTLAHAANGYVPTAIGYEHGSYETFNCRFVQGSGEAFANEMIRLLNECNK